MVGGPGLVVSLTTFVAALGCAILANLQMRRPYERRVRGVPWLGVQFVAVLTCIVMMSHIVTLLLGHDPHGNRWTY